MLVIYSSVTLGTRGFCNLILDMVSFFIWDYFLHYIHGKSPLDRNLEKIRTTVSEPELMWARISGWREGFVVI